MKEYQMTISKKSTTGYDNKWHLANVAIKIYYDILFILNSRKTYSIFIYSFSHTTFFHRLYYSCKYSWESVSYELISQLYLTHGRNESTKFRKSAWSRMIYNLSSITAYRIKIYVTSALSKLQHRLTCYMRWNIVSYHQGDSSFSLM